MPKSKIIKENPVLYNMTLIEAEKPKKGCRLLDALFINYAEMSTKTNPEKNVFLPNIPLLRKQLGLPKKT